MDEKNKYHRGIPSVVKRENGVMCLYPTSESCPFGLEYCERCGWNTKEAERRKMIPLEEYTHEVRNKLGEVVLTEKRRRKFLNIRPRTEQAVDE